VETLWGSGTCTLPRVLLLCKSPSTSWQTSYRSNNCLKMRRQQPKFISLRTCGFSRVLDFYEEYLWVFLSRLFSWTLSFSVSAKGNIPCCPSTPFEVLSHLPYFALLPPLTFFPSPYPHPTPSRSDSAPKATSWSQCRQKSSLAGLEDPMIRIIFGNCPPLYERLQRRLYPWPFLLFCSVG